MNLDTIFALLASIATAVSIPLCLCYILAGSRQLKSYLALPDVLPNELAAARLRHQQLTRVGNRLAIATIVVTVAGIVLGLFSSTSGAWHISLLVLIIGSGFARYFHMREENRTNERIIRGQHI